MGRKKSTENIDNIVKVKQEIPTAHTEGLPYYDDIRASWVVNQRHCDPNSPEGRKTLIDKNIQFCDEWLGELGWIRYYLFHIDNNYVKGKSKLIRVNDTQNFSPTNCMVVDKEKRKKKEISIKAKSEKKENGKRIEKTNTESNINTPSIVYNNFIVASSDMKNLQDIIKSVNQINNKTLTEDDNKIIYLNPIDNQSKSHIKRKN